MEGNRRGLGGTGEGLGRRQSPATEGPSFQECDTTYDGDARRGSW